MIGHNFLKLLNGANILVQDSTKLIKTHCSEFIEKNILKDHYVTREEFLDLKSALIKVQDENIKLRELLSDIKKSRNRAS